MYLIITFNFIFFKLLLITVILYFIVSYICLSKIYIQDCFKYTGYLIYYEHCDIPVVFRDKKKIFLEKKLHYSSKQI